MVIIVTKEVDNYIYLCEKIKNKDFQKRVKNSLEYYIKNANFYKFWGMVLSILGIVLPALATIFTVCSANKILIACVTSAATVASGIFAYLKCSDKQEAYRKAAENMKAELVAYAAEQGDYKGDGTKSVDKDAILFERIENIIQSGYDRIVEIDKEGEKPED
ncbi:MAG: DUF4231 domain-containing protein [Lachnospiraceae bacterium]|nr:DUF4231 domain-containing protein [Lachnospiraceae bacterium]MDE7178659.1 DUF4231 domain-containing protein [Lachnospiraceae bacterium]